MNRIGAGIITILGWIVGIVITLHEHVSLKAASVKQRFGKSINESADVIISGVMITGFITLIAIVSVCVGADSQQILNQREAVKRGYAEYDRHTGKWQWIERKPYVYCSDPNQKRSKADVLLEGVDE